MGIYINVLAFDETNNKLMMVGREQNHPEQGMSYMMYNLDQDLVATPPNYGTLNWRLSS